MNIVLVGGPEDGQVKQNVSDDCTIVTVMAMANGSPINKEYFDYLKTSEVRDGLVVFSYE